LDPEEGEWKNITGSQKRKSYTGRSKGDPQKRGESIFEKGSKAYGGSERYLFKETLKKKRKKKRLLVPLTGLQEKNRKKPVFNQMKTLKNTKGTRMYNVMTAMKGGRQGQGLVSYKKLKPKGPGQQSDRIPVREREYYNLPTSKALAPMKRTPKPNCFTGVLGGIMK